MKYTVKVKRTSEVWLDFDVKDDEELQDKVEWMKDNFNTFDFDYDWDIKTERKDLPIVAVDPGFDPPAFTVIPSWLSRVPDNIKSINPENTTVIYNVSELEKAIVARTHTSKLTDAQRLKLAQPVTVYPTSMIGEPPIEYFSPMDMYKTNSEFVVFSNEKIKAMSSHSAPNSKIVNTLCAYDHPNGWLAYQAKTQILRDYVETLVEEEKETLESTIEEPKKSSGYSPAIKKVEND